MTISLFEILWIKLSSDLTLRERFSGDNAPNDKRGFMDCGDAVRDSWFGLQFSPLNAFTCYLPHYLSGFLCWPKLPPPPLPSNFHSKALPLHIIIVSHWIHFHVTFRCRWMSCTDQTFCCYENRQEPTIPIIRWFRPPKSPPLNALRTNTNATTTSAWPVISAATESRTALTHRMNSTATSKTWVSHLWSH